MSFALKELSRLLATDTPVVGAVVGIAMKFSSGLREGGYIPFGPFLAGAGLIGLVFGPQSVLNTLLGAWGL